MVRAPELVSPLGSTALPRASGQDQLLGTAETAARNVRASDPPDRTESIRSQYGLRAVGFSVEPEPPQPVLLGDFQPEPTLWILWMGTGGALVEDIGTIAVRSRSRVRRFRRHLRVGRSKSSSIPSPSVPGGQTWLRRPGVAGVALPVQWFVAIEQVKRSLQGNGQGLQPLPTRTQYPYTRTRSTHT